MLASADLPLSRSACPLGCRAEDALVIEARDRQQSDTRRFGVVRCDGCGLLRLQPRPVPQHMPAFYPADYLSYRVQPVSPGGLRGVLRRAAARRLMRHATPGNLLEVGCATGRRLIDLREIGWRVSGIEPSEEAAERARLLGLSVHVGTLEDAPAPENTPLDGILAQHVFEHLHEPLTCLRRLRQWARPGALLVCSVPNAASWLLRAFGPAWYDLDLPRHLFHYTPESIRALLLRAGWQVEHVVGERSINGLVGSLGYWLADRGQHRLSRSCKRVIAGHGITKVVAFPLTATLAALNQSGRMLVRARASC